MQYQESSHSDYGRAIKIIGPKEATRALLSPCQRSRRSLALDYYTHADDDKSPSITKPSVASVSPGGKLLKLASALRLI
jgi:hypothetical protein